MITLILLIIGSLWLVYNRVVKKRIVPGQHLAMPAGTIRAFISMIVVSFPLTFYLQNSEIPGGISNAIFIVIAFYFQGRTHTSDFKEIIFEIRNPKKSYHEKLPASQLPFYLPKFTVRTTLVLLLVIYWVLNGITATLSFSAQSNILDIFQILIFFGFGKIVHEINDIVLKKRYKDVVNSSNDSEDKLIQDLRKSEESKGDITYGVYAIIAFIATITATILFTFELDYVFVIPIVSDITWTFYVRNTLLFFITGYFGYK